MPPKPAEPDMTTYSGRLAARLKELRERSGISTEEMATRIARAGYPMKVPGYRHWESGRAKVNLDAVPAIVMALNLTSAHDLLPQA